MADVNPLDLLKEEMENDETYLRVNAIHRLKIVAEVIGGEQIKSQLLPYVDSLIKKEEDEVLFAIAEEMENLAPFFPNNQCILLQYLENLASQDETVVRDAATKSLINMIPSITDSEIVNQFAPMLLRLANSQTNFACRVSAVNLMCPVYKKSGQYKEKIRQKFSELCSEETPMVRRAVASKIGNLALVIEKEFVLTEIITNTKQLIQDEQDQVRVLALNSLNKVAKVLNKDENKQHTLPIIIAATEDKSWRVRLALSTNFSELVEAFGKEVTDVSLIQIFTNLLRDCENEVRVASIESLQKFIKNVSSEKLMIVVPHLQHISRDSIPQVRIRVSDVLAKLSGILSKDVAVSKLMPHLVEMFNDEHKEVRQSVTVAAVEFIKNVGDSIINTFLPLFKKSIEDEKWRVRFEGYQAVVTLAKHFENSDVFFKTLEPLFMTYLKDKVFAIQELGYQQLGTLVKIFQKTDWINSKLLPKLMENIKVDQGYKYRILSLLSLKSVALNISESAAQEKILPVIYKHCNDPVPNIRFTVVNILKEIVEKFNSNAIKSDIKSHIAALLNDSDRDAKYFATELNSQL